MLRSKKINETTAFKVKELEPKRWLLWEEPDTTLSWGDRTRPITRPKQRYAWGSPGSASSSLELLEFGDLAIIRVHRGLNAALVVLILWLSWPSKAMGGA